MATRHLIVAGFHRSGTSMTAQVLQRAGLPLGRALILPHPSNRDGHFEDADIVEAHEDLLGETGQGWDYEAPGLPDVSGPRLDNLRRLAAERDARDPVWGFKDPRVCLFLDAWEEVLDRPGVLVVFRHYRATTASLLNRAAWSLATSPPAWGAVRLWSEPARPLRMWLQHNRALVDFARKHPDRTLAISHERLLAGHPLVESVNEFFGLGLDAGAETGIRHQRRSAADPGLPEVEASLLEELDRTWADLCELAGEEPAAVEPPAGPGSAGDEPDRLAELLTVLPPPAGASIGSSIDPPAAGEPEEGVEEEALGHLQRGDPRRALAVLAPLLRADPASGPVLALAGRAQAALGRYDLAERSFRDAIAAEPGRPGHRVELGRCLMRAGAAEAADDLLRSVEQSHPRVVAAPMLRCELLHRQGRHEEAVETARRAVGQHPDVPPPAAALARALHRTGRYHEALEVAAEAAERFADPGDPIRSAALHNQAAALHHQVGQHELGEDAARRGTLVVLSSPGYADRLRQALAAVPPGRRRDAERRVAGQLDRMLRDVGLLPGVGG